MERTPLPSKLETLDLQVGARGLVPHKTSIFMNIGSFQP